MYSKVVWHLWFSATNSSLFQLYGIPNLEQGFLMESSKNYIDKNVHIQKKTLQSQTSRWKYQNPNEFCEMFTKFGGKKYLSTLGFWHCSVQYTGSRKYPVKIISSKISNAQSKNYKTNSNKYKNTLLSWPKIHWNIDINRLIYWPTFGKVWFGHGFSIPHAYTA